MPSIFLKCVFFVVWFVHLDADVYKDRPRIKTNDGHLILEPAVDKNIYLQTNGPKSSIFVGGINLLTINVTDKGTEQYQPPNTDFDRYLNGPEGILQRLERLESRRDVQPSDSLFNVTLLWRRVNRLTTRIMNLQNLVNNMGIDQCQSRPCLHGGTCLNLANGYHCLCPTNWEGKACDEDVNECRIYQGTELGCQNRANCKNTPGSYECDCSPGWYGQHCTRKSKDCSGGDFEMCGHGTCVPTNTGQGIKCICEQGWMANETGAACLTDINECESHWGPRCSVNPKVECINLPGSFRCGQCPPGYLGDGYVCSDIDECLTIPNGGCSTSPLVTCHNTIGSRICGSCPVGYQGDGITCTWRGSCSINRGGCHPSAQCIDNSALGGQMAQCVCPPEMEGDGIGLHGCYVSTRNHTGGCDTNPCGIHGQCHPLRSGYTCICYKGYGGAHCDRTHDYCSSNPCLNGGRCSSDESSSRGFRCECTAQYSGDLCHVMMKTCGGYLQAEEGSIVYPLSNTTYNHNARCAWVIHTDSDKVINVTFSKFNLEANPECIYDFLQIHDGRSSASQIIGRFCGNEFPKGGNIISSHNNLYFWFRSDQTVSKDGFALHWTSIQPICGGEVDAQTNGHISTPGSPGKYPPNRDCFWHLSTTLGKRIQLHFFSLDIEVHSNCSYDFVAIYDGAQNTDPLIGQYCNSTLPVPVTSAGSDILVHFHSDGYGSGYGFQIAFTPTDGVPGCGGLYTADKGEISSPSYDGKYLSNVICEYKIKTSLDSKIRINFKSFHLERSLRCKYDYLKVYDGPSENSQLVGRFCGSTYPKSYTSSTNQLYIKFKSDHSVSSEGFRITYETVCQQTVIGDSGFIKSPGYPLSYPANRVCEYLIGTSPGKVIQLTFQDFDIEDNNYYNCQYDSVEIRDGININSTLLGKYCGGTEHMPPTKTSSHNYMYLKFNSDLSLSGTGFFANFTTIDVECGGIYKDTTGIINHPSASQETYTNDQHCTWVLLAPAGMHIKLTWNRFNLESMPSCRSDYVKLSEIDENNLSNDLGKYCGNTFPPAITTSTNQLQIEFQSDASVRLDGFSLSYAFLDERLHCGGTYTKTQGIIHSPGWPKRYPNVVRDCIWIITAPAGRQIVLNITQFDLERATMRGKCDYGDFLEIRNGASQAASLIGTFCGNFPSKFITSLSNTLYLKFHTDSYISGNGFKIEWSSTITGCGGTLTSPSGSITSPNYPLNYNENAECFYRIVTNAGSKLRLSFTELDLEISHKCRDDYLEIFDGRDENFPSLGKYCNKNQLLRAIVSTSNYLFVKFRSDFFIGGKGFLLEYSTICENNLTGFHGVIESPGYPNSYYNSYLNCLWTITVPKGNRINMTFTDFDLSRYSMISRRRFESYENSLSYSTYPRRRPNFEMLDCAIYIQMKDLSDINFGEKICGQTLPARISSTDNVFQIKFHSNSFFSFRGFRLEWARYGCGGHIEKDYGTLSIDSTLTSRGEIECEWMIRTKEGTSVTVTIMDLYMTTSVNCSTDAIEFYNGQDISTPLLSKICHLDVMSLVISSTNLMLVRFVKHSSLKDVRFSLQFDSHRTGCGGRIQALTGLILSKNYPKNYDNDMDCMWTIVVPKNHRIKLNFTEIDLYSISDSDLNCGDSIKIYDFNEYSQQSNYTKRICPNTQSSSIISKNHFLGIQFISDHYGTAKGFKANFTVICGATITAKPDGVIENDKWHTTHILDNCTWTILAPSLDQKISLTVTHMAIPKDSSIITNRNCPSSFLRVHDGSDDGAPLVDEYCGNKAPPMIVSRGSALTLVFGAYNGTAQGQFAVHYSAMTSACGGTLTSEEGSIASPNYPQSYPGNANCEWILRTSPGNKVYVTFEQFDLEWSENCNEDYLEVRENHGGGTLLGVYCGSNIPTNTTTASKLYLKFHSNKENSGRGFIIHYGFLHGNDIIGLENGEIASPLYPKRYDGAGEYSWRISTEADKMVSIIVNNVDIPTQGSICYNSLTFYDGYNDEAPVLEELCGLQKSRKEIKSSSNIVFIKLKLDDSNSGSIFHISWTNADVDMGPIDTGTIPNCGFNQTKNILPGQIITIKSPGYPEPYKENLNCEWVFQATSGRHVNLHFSTFKLEEMINCYADYVSVFSSDSLLSWRPVKEKFCLSEDIKEDFNSSTYMKIVFITDSSMSRQGFQAEVSSACGGFLNGPSGIVEPTYEDIKLRGLNKCYWTVKVRPGRVIKMNFEHFNITCVENDCSTNVIIRNGDSVEAPMIGNMKYCGKEHENRENSIESLSNVVFISYSFGFYINMRTFTNFRLRYEEKGIECGGTSILDFNHKWEVLNSPNYPSVPTPYIECVWVFKGPPGEILRIDFIERFDLDRRSDCELENVEIRDGSTDISLLKGRYCGNTNPGTIKTTENSLYIKYITQIPEPRDGFKANVSIDVCGGTITGSKGELTSPGYPRLQAIPYGSICEWRIVGPLKFTLLVKPQDIQLPESSVMCGTKITVEEYEPVNNTITVLQTYCAGDENADLSAIQTSSNEVKVKLHIGSPSEWSPPVSNRGFRFTFNSSRPTCGGDLTTPEGFLTTPSYPRETTIRYCQWRITVPDKTRRVRLELLDSNTEKHRLGIYNDLYFQTSVKILPSENNLETTNVYESTGNTMALYLWVDSLARQHRFKARFSSDEAAMCGGVLSESRGELFSPDLDRSYTCTWQYKPSLITTNTSFGTMYITAKLNNTSSINRNNKICSFTEPKLTIKINHNFRYGIPFKKQLCKNIDTSFSIPSNDITLTATKAKISSFYFHIEWKLNPCGGMIEVGNNAINVLNIPNDFNDTIDCAWFVNVPVGLKMELKLEGSFQFDCDNEFIKINHALNDRGPMIGDYCRDKMQDSPFINSFGYMHIQYHSKMKTNTSIRLMAKTISDSCGGVLSDYQRFFQSPNFPNKYKENMECSWEINSNVGNRISLHFIERFSIEDRTNCSKDAVLVYDWKDESWAQMARLCGRVLPPAFNSTYNRLKVVLRTDAETELDGFKAQWETICGGRYYATNKEQYLYSPGTSNIYLPNMDCTYEILGGGNKILIKFLEFSLEGTYPECKYDNLTISAHYRDNYIYDTYCESEVPAAIHEYNKVSLIFKTDQYIERKGFKLSYQIYSCGGQITQPTVLSSHSDSNNYDYNENCTWVIQAPTDKIVVVKFQYIELESTSECFADFVAVFNSNWIDEDKRMALMCGNINKPTLLRSTGNMMVVQFLSDSSINSKGFKADILFSYSSAVGCGGDIDLTNLSPGTTQALNSPLINSSTVYENFLDCHWTLKASVGYTVKIKFTQFHIAPCDGVNQTAIGFSKCECDYVQIVDGINPNDLLIGTYCGHNIPDGQVLISSGNRMSVNLHTDGEISSAGFKAELSVQPYICGQTVYTVTDSVQIIKSPGYTSGTISRGVHCVYHLDSQDSYRDIHLTIKDVDLRVGEPDANQCNKDKLLIISVPEIHNSSLGKDLILDSYTDFFNSHNYVYYEEELRHPDQYEYCGHKKDIDLYLSNSITIHLQTFTESDSMRHKGFEIHVSYSGFCGRNFTEVQGRISNALKELPKDSHDCYTLITVPENYTISLYFLYISYASWEETVRLDIFDGDKTSSPKLRMVEPADHDTAVFSTGRHVLIYNPIVGDEYLVYDLNYMATDKGRGCGGKYHNLLGKVMSPFYPNTYRQRATCEWELETPSNTHLRLQFTVFDLGRACDTNYVKLVDRSGNTISTYCSETPAFYVSTDNYVKIVYITTQNNGGTGWVADFIAVI